MYTVGLFVKDTPIGAWTLVSVTITIQRATLLRIGSSFVHSKCSTLHVEFLLFLVLFLYVMCIIMLTPTVGGKVCRLGKRWVVNASGGLESKGKSYLYELSPLSSACVEIMCLHYAIGEDHVHCTTCLCCPTEFGLLTVKVIDSNV